VRHADDVASGKFRFQKGEILFGKLRPYFHKVGVPAVDGVCSTDVLVITPREKNWFGVLLGFVSSDEMIAHTDTSSTGTRMPRTNWDEIARYEIAIPTKEIADLASVQITRIVDRLHANIFDSRVLTRTRDKLHPRLLSGELDMTSDRAFERAST
jgi:type I restriction enzyme S subunit